jgi:hypothetical protein
MTLIVVKKRLSIAVIYTFLLQKEAIQQRNEWIKQALLFSRGK